MNDWSGVFGKHPEARDFVTKGVPAPIRRGFDRWLTRNVVGFEGAWPDCGLRGLLTFGTSALFIAIPSHDKVGRRFPLAALTADTGLSLEEADQWCDTLYAVLQTVASGSASLDELSETLDKKPKPTNVQDRGEDAIWVKGALPMAPNAESLEALGFGSP